MYNEDRFKHLIGEASFDGWVENDGPNADIDEDCQLLREDRALEIIAEAKAEFPTLKPLEIAKYLHEVEAWEIKWLGKSSASP